MCENARTNLKLQGRAPATNAHARGVFVYESFLIFISFLSGRLCKIAGGFLMCTL